MRPFHHGDASGEPSNWLQGFNDSEAGVLVGGILHSVGALLFAGGIALYLYVAHSIRRSAADGSPANVGLLAYAHLFTLVGILLNGIGGLMRLLESDHPGLDRLGDSTWVQVLFLKHLLLLAGIGLAAWLWWTTRRVSLDGVGESRTHRDASRMGWFAAASFTSIVLAAILGTAAANVDLAADLGTGTPMLETDADGHEGHGEAEVLAEYSTSGTITGSPANPGESRHQATIPTGTDRLTAVLRWEEVEGLAPSELSMRLEDPQDRRVEAEETRTAGVLTLLVAGESVAPGFWTVVVSSERALQEGFQLYVSAVRSNGQGNVLDRTVSVPGGGAFFEANLLMGSGKTITYDWELRNTTARIHFDIHLHVNGEVRYAVTGDYNAYNGSFVHDGSSQGPSLLWQNDGTQPVELHFRIRGDFALHSYYPE